MRIWDGGWEDLEGVWESNDVMKCRKEGCLISDDGRILYHKGSVPISRSLAINPKPSAAFSGKVWLQVACVLVAD